MAPVGLRRIAATAVLVAILVLQACQNGDGPQSMGKNALIIVDMQYDFMPGGALAAPNADEIVPLINRLQGSFDLIVATQDWHPPDHASFASSHPGRDEGDVIDLDGIEQVLWPDHAVQGSHGAELVAGLDTSRIARVFRKGMDPEVDSYSGFFDNGRKGETGLRAYLQSQGVSDVYVVGLALDYCVKYTALDAQSLGYRTTVVVDATRPVNRRPGDSEAAVSELESSGVRVLQSMQLQ